MKKQRVWIDGSTQRGVGESDLGVSGKEIRIKGREFLV